MKIDATHIKKMLDKRHSEDFYICEVKNGSSWYSDNLLKFDALAMKKSWRNPLITIYEVKVSRQDFLRDQKYLKYMEYCHELYFACPPDLIEKNEIPENADLVLPRDLMLIVSELAEALEALRKNKRADLVNYNQFMKDGNPFEMVFQCQVKDTFEDEIADTFIRLFHLCGMLNIDIETHIKLKMEYNKTREKMHGGKKF